MENKEELLQALHEFERMADDDRAMSPELESLVSHIAKTGQLLFPWNALKPLFMFKLDKVMRDFFESSPSRNSSSSEPTHTAEFEVMRQRLLDCLDTFTSAPFTIQRLCELMVEPRKHYHNSEKFMRGVEKNVLVVSTVDVEIENDRDGFFNNVEGAHTVPNLPLFMNGPLTNGERVMTVAVSTAGQSVTADSQSGDQDNSHSDRVSLHTPANTQQSAPTTNGDSVSANNLDVSDHSSAGNKTSIAENGENEAVEQNKENENEELVLASETTSASTSDQESHSNLDDSQAEKEQTTEVSSTAEESVPAEEKDEEASDNTESREDSKEPDTEDLIAEKKEPNAEEREGEEEPMDQSA